MSAEEVKAGNAISLFRSDVALIMSQMSQTSQTLKTAKIKTTENSLRRVFTFYVHANNGQMVFHMVCPDIEEAPLPGEGPSTRNVSTNRLSDTFNFEGKGLHLVEAYLTTDPRAEKDAGRVIASYFPDKGFKIG